MKKQLLEQLKLILSDEKYYSKEEYLLKGKIIEDALKMDKNLIKTLKNNTKLRKKFFTVLEDNTLVFNQDKFTKFVKNKEFLENSYTSYSNKIGLTDLEGNSLNKKNDIVLSWPYKDCYLEGGQKKEDQEKNEVFYNKILAQDEIDRLLDPKVFIKFKRISKKGEKKVKNINEDDNLIIKGNNLLALYSLKKKFKNKVKLIYIDPPYNRKRGNFNYNDKFNHSTWLTFMKNRLEIAKKLLKEDGAIIVSCDDNEQAYLKVVMDEVFDRENFLLGGVVNRPSQTAKDATVSMHEYFIVFTKDKEKYSPNGKKRYTKSRGTVGNEDQTMPIITFPAGLECKGVEDGIYEETRKIEGSKENIENLDPIIVENGVLKEDVRLKARWRSSNDMRNFFDNNCNPTEAKINGVIDKIYFKGDRFVPQIQKRIIEKIPSLITDNKRGSKDLEKLGINEDFAYPKSVEYIKKLINYIVSDDDIVLDFFAGSGTTAQAVLELNEERNSNIQFILCEQLDYIKTLTKERLKKVINEVEKGDFIYCELMKWNERFIDQIQKASSTQKLLDIYKKIKEKAFLNYKFDIKEFEKKNMKGFKKLDLDEQRGILINCLDLNQLYVNYSEIEDSDYGVSEEIKKLNKDFYSYS